jgi:hypothetical protein
VGVGAFCIFLSVVAYNGALLNREKTRRLNGGDSTAIVA